MRYLRLGLIAVVVFAGTIVRAEDAKIGSAQAKLREAQETLRGVGGGFGGHRERALTHINQALEELGQAQRVDTHHDQKDEKKVNTLEKKEQHIEHRIDNLQNK